jgi:hypothetical protein
MTFLLLFKIVHRPECGRRDSKGLRVSASNHVLHGPHPVMKALGFSVGLRSAGVFAW